MNSVIKPAAIIKGGTKVPHLKDTMAAKSLVMPSPPLVIIPMQQHIGAPCKPTVKPGDQVLVGQVIADTEAFVSAPIHSSVSGKVKSISPVLMSNGSNSDAIHIENDGRDEPIPNMGPIEISSKADFLSAVRASGLVGIGGAGFPLHVKLSVKDDVNIDTLVINGAECEPYITSDYREIVENPERIIAGTELVMKYLNIPRGVIGIESNKPNGIKVIAKCLKDRNSSADIDVMELPASYPQGAEKVLIYSATGRKVPPGGLPSAIGCIVMNVSTVSLLQHYLSTGIPLIKKRLTVSGGAIKEPKNVVVPIGSTIKDAVEFCGGFSSEPAKILFGGPMMGVAQYYTDMPIMKQNNAIIALTDEQTLQKTEEPCIRCGRCVYTCPMSLLPVFIDRYAKNGDADNLTRLNVSNCMECGSCAYVCPSNRPLVQYMKNGKAVQRQAVKK